jgi:hypothetical protein
MALAHKISSTQAKVITPAQFAGGSSGERLFLIHANDYSGHRAYYFLLANPLRLPQLKKAISTGISFDLESYGEIVASGYGAVPAEVRTHMRKEYGWKDGE